ncbi:MAG: DUF732 domain-containing protein [Actinomycetia bacterium]|nr:DUF732 domain-containing protein [Actinomycetes bacterium]
MTSGDAADKRPITCPACLANLRASPTAKRVHCPECDVTFPATPADFAANRSPRGWKTGAVIAIASGAFLAGCVGGCTFGVLTSNDSSSSREPASPEDAIPRISPVPITPSAEERKDYEFGQAISGLGMSGTDARMLAASSCLAFKQNPGTSMDAAANQLAPQQSWTYHQARRFLRATTASYCPEYQQGS